MPRKKKNKVNNDIRVVTQNEFNNVSLATFTPNENKILHAIVAKIKNKDTQKIQISFDEIKYLKEFFFDVKLVRMLVNKSKTEFAKDLSQLKSRFKTCPLFFKTL